MNPLQGFEHGAIVLRQQAARNMQTIIRVDTDQMRVERSVMNFGRDAIGHNGLPELFVLVGDDDLSCQSWNERMWSDGIGRTSALGISSASRWLSIGGK
jgi:hypothetical protein